MRFALEGRDFDCLGEHSLVLRWYTSAQVLRLKVRGREICHRGDAVHCQAPCDFLCSVLFVNTRQRRLESLEFEISVPLGHVLRRFVTRRWNEMKRLD